MIRISNQYIDRFKKIHCEYLYYIKPGTFLAFDKDTHEYIGVEYFYFGNWNNDQKFIDEKLNELITSGILEII